MDSRRPVRPPPASRRALFHPQTSQPRRANPHNPSTHTKPSVHIAVEEASPEEDLVERDASGNYRVAGPTTAMKVGTLGTSSVKSEGEEAEKQERQMISMFGQENGHWDQAAILEEIKHALQNNLERKVQSLEADKWMFEGEGKSKG
ncbi:hypothetical protein P280DRAFT_470964 [Massarina eburnea CBS 473.64]|uniref:Uncharacterized protein n=1 Tax=Massarina eburnea CBS 473.64 TaxID=1395130 RepID=A0A6A6RXL7_9PLEO|nr:hypothetical protein P280DRAFT_470964 [Massarina eburnea CBS 473.64]